MASTASGSTHSLSAGPATAGNASSGGMEELLPLVLQLTNAESVSGIYVLCCVCGVFVLSLWFALRVNIWVVLHPYRYRV